jgi:ligand-binding SRPBCC domain-containing protein
MTLIPVSEVPEKMYPGVLFKYKVKPVAGIPLTWVTKITHVQDKQYFIDEQLVGPYSIWHHEHHFKAIKGGVEMTDILWYQVPFGPLGKLVNSIFIKKKVKDIFEYRTKVLIDMFGEI